MSVLLICVAEKKCAVSDHSSHTETMFTAIQGTAFH